MARKKRNLATFDEFAETNINNNNSTNNGANSDINQINDDNKNISINDNKYISDNENINTNVNVNINEKNNNAESPGDYLDKLIEGNTKKKSNETVLTGIYLQKDISQILDRLAKKGGRGAKSKIVNEALKTIFEDKGLL